MHHKPMNDTIECLLLNILFNCHECLLIILLLRIKKSEESLINKNEITEETQNKVHGEGFSFLKDFELEEVQFNYEEIGTNCNAIKDMT